MPTIYIAGPMRGYAENNFPAFFAADDYSRDLGYTVENPARMDTEHPLLPTDADPDPWIARDLLAVRRSDEIALLGWDWSVGATCEAALAAWLRKKARFQYRDAGGVGFHSTPANRFRLFGSIATTLGVL